MIKLLRIKLKVPKMAKIDFTIENGINNTNHICEYNNIKKQIYYCKINTPLKYDFYKYLHFLTYYGIIKA